jgi:hypothetical protein
MATEVVGYGQGGVNRYAFGLNFSQALSSLCTYHAYDNNQTFPTLESTPLTSVLNEIFTHGHSASNDSMIALIDTTNAEPSDTWATTLAAGGGSAGEANPNFLLGDTAWVEQDGAVFSSADQTLLWNMLIEVDYQVETSDDMRFELCIKYTYTGTAPSLTWRYNVGSAPTSWSTMTPGTHGIKHCRSGASAGAYYANIPETGQEWTAEAWVCTVGE